MPEKPLKVEATEVAVANTMLINKLTRHISKQEIEIEMLANRVNELQTELDKVNDPG